MLLISRVIYHLVAILMLFPELFVMFTVVFMMYETQSWHLLVYRGATDVYHSITHHELPIAPLPISHILQLKKILNTVLFS